MPRGRRSRARCVPESRRHRSSEPSSTSQPSRDSRARSSRRDSLETRGGSRESSRTRDARGGASGEGVTDALIINRPQLLTETSSTNRRATRAREDDRRRREDGASVRVPRARRLDDAVGSRARSDESGGEIGTKATSGRRDASAAADDDDDGTKARSALGPWIANVRGFFIVEHGDRAFGVRVGGS